MRRPTRVNKYNSHPSTHRTTRGAGEVHGGGHGCRESVFRFERGYIPEPLYIHGILLSLYKCEVFIIYEPAFYSCCGLQAEGGEEPTASAAVLMLHRDCGLSPQQNVTDISTYSSSTAVYHRTIRGTARTAVGTAATALRQSSRGHSTLLFQVQVPPRWCYDNLAYRTRLFVPGVYIQQYQYYCCCTSNALSIFPIGYCGQLFQLFCKQRSWTWYR